MCVEWRDVVDKENYWVEELGTFLASPRRFVRVNLMCVLP